MVDGQILENMCAHYQTYLDANGNGSQPWKSMCIVVADKEDYDLTVEQIAKGQFRMVRTFKDFLNEFSAAE